MIIQRDELTFARRAVRQGLVSGEQMLECIKFLRNSKNSSLKDILLRTGYANKEAIEKIERYDFTSLILLITCLKLN